MMSTIQMYANPALENVQNVKINFFSNRYNALKPARYCVRVVDVSFPYSAIQAVKSSDAMAPICNLNCFTSVRTMRRKLD